MACIKVTIAAGVTTSAEVDCGSGSPARIDLPSAMTGTTLTIHVKRGDGTFGPLYTDTDQPLGVITFSASKTVGFFTDDLRTVRSFKLVSNDTEVSEVTFYVWTVAFTDEGTPL